MIIGRLKVYTAIALVLANAPYAFARSKEVPLGKLASSTPVSIPMNVLFIYDSSGSMWGLQEGNPRVDMARQVLKTVIGNVPPDAKLGLIAYGHRSKSSCEDIEALAPLGTKTATEIKRLVETLKPRGTTPLSGALGQAGELLKDAQGAKMIVLITDGAEECSGDPCEITRQLAKDGLVVRVNVVGLSLSDKERSQLQCIAREGNGRYFNVKNNETLQKAITELSDDIETYAVQTTAKVIPEPSAPAPAEINLLLKDNGGHIADADNLRWNNSISGNENSTTWIVKGRDVVFGFKNNEPATFSRFRLAVHGRLPQNVQDFELMASTESAEGPFFLIGRFSVANVQSKETYQDFTFSKTTARYIKFKPLSNYGYRMQGWGDTEIGQMQLMGVQE